MLCLGKYYRDFLKNQQSHREAMRNFMQKWRETESRAILPLMKRELRGNALAAWAIIGLERIVRGPVGPVAIIAPLSMRVSTLWPCAEGAANDSTCGQTTNNRARIAAVMATVISVTIVAVIAATAVPIAIAMATGTRNIAALAAIISPTIFRHLDAALSCARNALRLCRLRKCCWCGGCANRRHTCQQCRR